MFTLEQATKLEV